MTREEAITILNHNVSVCLHDTEWGVALDMAIKALEQEPILDKLRAEIEEVQTYKMFEGEDTVYVERKDVLAIINKYKAGGVDKE